ncbi:MAG: hypothetical protein ACHREM_16150 [Polyangiales bacterium]
MSQFYCLNTVRVGVSVVAAGNLVDEVSTDVAALRRAGATLWLATDPIVAQAAVRVAELRYNGLADDTLDRVMISAASDSMRMGPGNYLANVAALQAYDPQGLEGLDVVVLDTRARFTFSSLSTAPVDDVDVVAALGSDGGASPGRWLTDFVVWDVGDLRRCYAESMPPGATPVRPAPLATLSATGARYTFDPTSAAADDGVTVIDARSSAASFDAFSAPVGLGTNPGRWLVIT